MRAIMSMQLIDDEGFVILGWTGSEQVKDHTEALDRLRLAGIAVKRCGVLTAIYNTGGFKE